jgi:hypothetical protein
MQGATTIFSQEASDEQVALFFQGLKQELHLESIQGVVSLMRAVCAKVPWSFVNGGINRVMAGTPPLFNLLLKHSHARQQDSIRHLDELADFIYQESNRRKSRLFKTEVEALRGVIIVLTCIQKAFERIGLQPFGYTLGRELQQAAEGEGDTYSWS